MLITNVSFLYFGDSISLMAAYELLFQIAVILFLTSFVFWLVSIFFPKKGLEGIYMVFSYPAMLTAIIAAIMVMFVEELNLLYKFLLGGIALVWTITGMQYPPETKAQRIINSILQFISLIGAWIFIERFFL